MDFELMCHVWNSNFKYIYGQNSLMKNDYNKKKIFNNWEVENQTILRLENIIKTLVKWTLHKWSKSQMFLPPSHHHYLNQQYYN